MRQMILALMLASIAFCQQGADPRLEPGVSHDLAKWRAANYSDVRYKLDLTLEKMSPVLKGTIEIRLNVAKGSEPGAVATGSTLGPRSIVLDWRPIKGSESLSTISNVTLNGVAKNPVATAPGSDPGYELINEHLIFRSGVVEGENVVKLDFTSPILTSGSAITRYVDKEDGSEYIYSLFVPSDASTAFPVFDQPDLKARFTLCIDGPRDWSYISNSPNPGKLYADGVTSDNWMCVSGESEKPISTYVFAFAAGPFERFGAEGGNLSGSEGAPSASVKQSDTKNVPSALVKQKDSEGDPKDVLNQKGTLPTGRVSASGVDPATNGGNLSGSEGAPLASVKQSDTKNVPPALVKQRDSEVDPKNVLNQKGTLPTGRVSASGLSSSIYVRKSQAAKFKPHAAEVFRLNREGIKYLEEYFDYKFPFPKYDIVLIPEFPFGGMEHAGATFLREASVIFPTEPTSNDYITRANLIFHEAAHQWFGDTVTMRWFDDLWLKEGFAEFMAYKTLERVMPEYNAWKVFYERNKQAAYLTDSTKGTTPIYQEIKNLSAAKSAYGNIVYRKAPSFLRQAEFYIGEDKFQTAVRSFLKKHEFGNAGWEDLVDELEGGGGKNLSKYAQHWVEDAGITRVRIGKKWPNDDTQLYSYFAETDNFGADTCRQMKFRVFVKFDRQKEKYMDVSTWCDIEQDSEGKPLFEAVNGIAFDPKKNLGEPLLIFPNYGDYGYGIFLLDDKSRDHVLKNIQNEKDDFLRAMMWGALWDSVREAELDPREYVELVIKTLGTQPTVASSGLSRPPVAKKTAKAGKKSAEAGTQSEAPAKTGTQNGTQNTGQEDESTIQTLLGRVATALNYYVSDAQRAELAPRFDAMLLDRLQNAKTPGQRITYFRAFVSNAETERGRQALKQMIADSTPANPGDTPRLPLKTKDRFDIVTRLAVLGDAEAEKLLAEIERTETSDEAKRYAYAARAAFPNAENKAKYWNDFVNNKELSESWIEAAFIPFNSIRHADLTRPYLEKALAELPNLKRTRKIFFVNGWLNAFIGGQRSDAALAAVNKFLADNPQLDNDLRLKVLENADIIERAVKIRGKYGK